MYLLDCRHHLLEVHVLRLLEDGLFVEGQYVDATLAQLDEEHVGLRLLDRLQKKRQVATGAQITITRGSVHPVVFTPWRRLPGSRG